MQAVHLTMCMANYSSCPVSGLTEGRGQSPTLQRMMGILLPFRISSVQSLVLLFRRFDPDHAPANIDGVIDRLARFEVEITAPAFSHLKQFLGIVENDPSGQGRLQIFFEKLAMPTLTQHEAHIDPVTRAIGASLFARSVGRG